ncbi:MAG: protein DpdE [Burkholderiaceae bacterium]|nr:protein DpdE [Burkholderiaceae bacterium]
MNATAESARSPFVTIDSRSHASWGVGKLLRIQSGSATVQYFDGPGLPWPEPVDCPISQVRRVLLATQTRVFRRHSAGRWQAGRVLESEGDSVFVQFPNLDCVNLDADEVFVRWSRPLRDPLPLLAAEATESPFLANARAAFVRQVSLQRTAAAGISAILSSSIDLVDYQFEVIRRVLTDPVQRYLLADEVGLGKTIEAATILRQYFLDHPTDARAVVLAPPTLVQQWRDELSSRFGLGDHLDEALLVHGHADQEALTDALAGVGMLVVDEAHHLAREDENMARLYALLRERTPSVPRLLLLSATPVLGDEKGFLRVLHLLDPVVFPLEDLDGFRRRIASRQLVAEIVANLTPGNLWGLAPELERLEATYGQDALLLEKTAALRAVLEAFPAEDDEGFLAALADLRIHLVESYRLHRRLLRNRRAAVSWATPRRSGVTVETFRSELAPRLREDLDQLRLSIDPASAAGLELAPSLMQAAIHNRAPTALGPLLERHAHGDGNAVALAEAVDAISLRLHRTPERFDALLSLVGRLLTSSTAQIVVFCDQRADADRAAGLLQGAFLGLVARHEVDEPSGYKDEAQPTWRSFLLDPERVRVLVCDARAEEGVNLHGGRKVAIHFDLPVSPNRIEQRMGRLDRYGRGDRIASYVLLDEASPDEAAWEDILASGWKVFEQSVASLQYLIESTSRSLADDWMGQGTAALIAHAAALGGPNGLVQNEIRQIDQQDTLDALGETPEGSIDALEDQDGEWREWRTAFQSFAIDVLGFEQRFEGAERPPAEEDRVFRVRYVHRDRGRPTLIPLTGFLRHFMQSLDLAAQGGGSGSPLTNRYAFRRQNAVTRTALAGGVHLLRVGDPLVTALEQLCELDDRGRAFAVWRVDRQYVPSDPSGADLYYRFDFIVKPAVREDAGRRGTTEALSSHALARKASTFMPPLAISVWVDRTGSIIDSPAEIVTAQYHDAWVGTRRDFNLNPVRWRAIPQSVRSTWLRDWPRLCSERRDKAVAAIADFPAYRQHVRKALDACAAEARLRHAQGSSRLLRLEGVARARELEEMTRDEVAYDAVRATLDRPHLHLDVVGAVFVASDTPFVE